MTIKDFFTFKWFVKGVSQPFVSILSQRFSPLLGSARSRKYLDEYRNWVFACIQARAEEVGNIQIRLFRQTADGDEEIFEHELLDLLNKVNPTMTRHDLFMGTQSYLDLDGNAFWFLARDRNGKGDIKELWLIRPDKIEIVPDKSNPLAVQEYIYTQQGGQRISFKPNEILQFKNFNPRAELPFPHRGLGVVEAASWSIDTDNESRQWNFSFFKNSAKPDGVLVKDGPALSPVQKNQLLKMWEQEHQGSANAHRPLILSGGIKWQDTSRTQKDMDFVEQRRFSRDEILALFRVPKTAIGIVEDVNRANAEATNFVFADRTIRPLMQKVIDTLNEFIVPEFGDDLFLDFKSPVPEDRLNVVNEYNLGIDRWLSRNEIRAREGLPPTRDGDRFFGNLAQIPIDAVSEEQVRAVGETIIKLIKGDPIESERSEKKKSKFYRPKKKTASEKIIEEFVSKLPTVKEEKKFELNPKAEENYIEMWKKIFEVQPGLLKKEMVIYFRDQEKEVLENIENELKGLEVKEYKLKQLEELFDEEFALSSGISLLTPFLREYIQESADQARLLTGAPTVLDMNNPDVVKFLAERAELTFEGINQKTKEDLLKDINQGIGIGESKEQIKDRISKYYDSIEDFRAERIARTEVAAASNFGAKSFYEQAGFSKWKWIVVDPQDDDCLDNKGQEVEIGEEFESGDVEPPAHPNCQCTTIVTE